MNLGKPDPPSAAIVFPDDLGDRLQWNSDPSYVVEVLAYVRSTLLAQSVRHRLRNHLVTADERLRQFEKSRLPDYLDRVCKDFAYLEAMRGDLERMSGSVLSTDDVSALLEMFVRYSFDITR